MDASRRMDAHRLAALVQLAFQGIIATLQVTVLIQERLADAGGQFEITLLLFDGKRKQTSHRDKQESERSRAAQE